MAINLFTLLSLAFTSSCGLSTLVFYYTIGSALWLIFFYSWILSVFYAIIRGRLKKAMSMQENITNQLRRRLNLYRSLFLFLLLVCLSLTLYIIDLKSEGRFLKQLTAKKVICPHEKEVRRIISKLQYNGLYRLLQPDVYISLDFRNNAWILHNVHHFNPDGTIKLSEADTASAVNWPSILMSR